MTLVSNCVSSAKVQSIPLIVMAMCGIWFLVDFVELVLDVDVLALAPWASVDCMSDWLGICCRAVLAVYILVGFQSLSLLDHLL